ncbi:diguanylate cyclase [Pseudomonas sp. N040]|uniref:diguanylate cyclase n=1 Tax=Pseudomonas sp. N040 TaxID=2785325 RepID=UPI0018A2D600|nr:diguanylate cyclase [Pseudomonas sp. N040]MBF7731189.1 diguanylate cyclase [Pseudomonas sp. N040]MBW7014832.1 diguanylate cyclase [Pseudomonas sp. N040]
MLEQASPSRDRLKRHFARRVIHQARLTLEVWQRLQRGSWNALEMGELVESNLLLLRYAERFEQAEHRQLAQGIHACLVAVAENRGRLNSELIAGLNLLMQRLSRTGLRHNDQLEEVLLPALRKPIYVALQDHQQAARLCLQLQSYGLLTQAFDTINGFRDAMAERHPAAIVLDINFAGSGCGLQLAEQLHKSTTGKLPLLFFSQQDADTTTRLSAVRAGGQAFFIGSLEASNLLERIEQLTYIGHYEPYRVLVIDDSLAQAAFTERMLNSAGIVTRILTKPDQAMTVLADFQPDLIILDMYMPGCSGPELAKVIRHNDRYVSVPIIYLSAEDDLDKQLEAMGEGGDDFLTKPIKQRHLVATVRRRVARARRLHGLMVRDSLSGLYNHTHILQLLEDACLRARRSAQPLSFAMLDIDFFKKVNDTYGHPMGDRVIKSLALFLKQRLRKSDFIGRYGGEEFAVVLPDTDAPTAKKVIEDIRQRFAEILHPAQPQDLFCTFSCGIAELYADDDGKALSRKADQALYSAKQAGRNRTTVFPS